MKKLLMFSLVFCFIITSVFSTAAATYELEKANSLVGGVKVIDLVGASEGKAVSMESSDAGAYVEYKITIDKSDRYAINTTYNTPTSALCAFDMEVDGVLYPMETGNYNFGWTFIKVNLSAGEHTIKFLNSSNADATYANLDFFTVDPADAVGVGGEYYTSGENNPDTSDTFMTIWIVIAIFSSLVLVSALSHKKCRF